MQAQTSTEPVTCNQWDMLDLAFGVLTKPDDPFGVDFGATFYGPEGMALRAPGFYDGVREDGEHYYIVRFSPPETGRWFFETWCSRPGLAGRSGSFEALPPRPGQHGPVIVDPACPQRLRYADGTPYVLLAFEADWLALLDPPSSAFTPATQTLIDYIAAAGFNHVVMNVYAYDVPWPKDPALRPEHEYGAPETYPFGGSNDAPDFATLNTAYFQHLDRVVSALGQSGIVAHLMIYVWNKLVRWPEMYSQADNRFFDYVIARYQAFHNVVWDVSKEALGHGRCDNAYIRERIARIRRLDAYGRLLTVHDYAFCAAHPHLVDLISIQSWRSGLYDVMREVRERHPGVPVLNIEHGGYERAPYTVFPGDYDDPAVCLERNYACVFAGAYSTYYWQGTSWDVVIPDPTALPPDQQPHLSWYTNLADLLARYDYNALQPVAGGASSGYRLSDGQRRHLYLVPKENGTIHLTIAHLFDRPVRVTWFDPYTGTYVDAGEVGLRPWHAFTPPWPAEGMAVLILEAVE